MSTLIILDQKLDSLGGEMKTQTQLLGKIEQSANTMATVALADQEARDRIYDRLADGLIKMARVIGAAVLLILVLTVLQTFKQELHSTFPGGSIDMGKLTTQGNTQ